MNIKNYKKTKNKTIHYGKKNYNKINILNQICYRCVRKRSFDKRHIDITVQTTYIYIYIQIDIFISYYSRYNITTYIAMDSIFGFVCKE